MTSHSQTNPDLRYLKLLAREYPTVAKASSEIINLKAILCLPKGTEHFISDVHGESTAFLHMLKNASGVVREKVDTLFENVMTKLSDEFSGDILIAEAKKEVNYPGTSEYQTGFSFRMDLYSSTDAEFNKTKGYFQENERGQYFTENAWKYGIIFRFPVDDFPNSSWESKTYKTGISSRMNLYRYVGVAHSTAMRVMDYCLEEYVEFLMEHPHITIYQDGALKYEVYRIEASDTETSFSLPVPNPASAFQASLDNMGGIVLAYTYN